MYKFEKMVFEVIKYAPDVGSVTYNNKLRVVASAYSDFTDKFPGMDVSNFIDFIGSICENMEELPIFEIMKIIREKMDYTKDIYIMEYKQRLNSAYGMIAQSRLDPDKNSPFGDSLDVQTPMPDKLSAYPKIRFKKAEVQPLCGYCVCPSCGETLRYNRNINPMYCSDCGARFEIGDATLVEAQQLHGIIYKEHECPACCTHNWLRDENKVNYCWYCGKAWVPRGYSENPLLETKPFVYFHNKCQRYSYASENERIYCQYCGEKLLESECKYPQEIKTTVHPAACPQCGHLQYFLVDGSFHCTHCGAYIHYGKEGVECV